MAQVLKPVGHTWSYILFKDVILSMFEKVEKGEKKSMTGPGQPQTCSHPIYTQTFTGVCQAVRLFSLCQFHVFVSIIVPIYKRVNKLDTMIKVSHAHTMNAPHQCVL